MVVFYETLTWDPLDATFKDNDDTGDDANVCNQEIDLGSLDATFKNTDDNGDDVNFCN